MQSNNIFVNTLSLTSLSFENGGSFEKLNEEHSKVLFEHLNQHIYLYAKDIATYVGVNFGIKYSVSGMTVWLHTHGFSYKKPAVIPGKAK